MRETLWNVMVAVQQARRGRETRTTIPPAPRRKRPTTLRSIRSLLVSDHYALLMDGDY